LRFWVAQRFSAAIRSISKDGFTGLSAEKLDFALAFGRRSGSPLR
jgi:hypothetical protein